ncbi:hypothetical protein XENOCAPTIV_009604 [Xenoophorus captivus]|uniref:Uncharacterized protein n=1 Tax=Xenoophorus captivus TaxID=1517983 RepID=A0ABV0QV49_9TELE
MKTLGPVNEMGNLSIKVLYGICDKCQPWQHQTAGAEQDTIWHMSINPLHVCKNTMTDWANSHLSSDILSRGTKCLMSRIITRLFFLLETTSMATKSVPCYYAFYPLCITHAQLPKLVETQVSFQQNTSPKATEPVQEREFFRWKEA